MTKLETGDFERVERFHGMHQFIVKFTRGYIFQSYDTPIAARVGGKVYIFPAWKYSGTTSRYRALFLGESTKETREKIKNGEYIPVGYDFKILTLEQFEAVEGTLH